MLYVRMTDRFMSNWGAAGGARNVLVIACDTAEQAHAIAKSANERREMRRVQIVTRKPRARAGIVYSHRHVSELAGHWLAYMPARVAA